MTMNKKFLINLIAVFFLVVSSVFFLTACDTGVDDGGVDDGGGDDGTIEIPETPGEDQTLEELFEKFKVISQGDNVLVQDPVTGSTASFDYLLDRQLQVLATELLYRLVSVYGAGAVANEYTLTYDNGTIYSLNGNDAIIETNDIIQTPYKYNAPDPVYLYDDGTDIWAGYNEIDDAADINEIASYAYSLRSGVWNDSDLITKTFLLKNAIYGGYSLNEYGRFNTDTFDRTNYGWRWDYDGLGITPDSDATEVYTAYVNEYYERLLINLANIFAQNSGSTTEYDDYDLEYDNALSEITYLGITEQDRTDITDFVLQTIIGSNALDRDDTYYDSVTDVDALDGTILTDSNKTNLSETDHYYKAYNLLVPEIVNRSVAASFGGVEPDRLVYTDTNYDTLQLQNGKVAYQFSIDEIQSVTTVNGQEYDSLYPKMTRSGQEDIDIVALPEFDIENGEYPEIDMTNLLNIQRVILQPKTDVSLLELWFAIGTESNLKVQFNVRVTYVANGVKYLDNQIVSSYTNTSTGDKSLFEIEGLYDTGDSVAGQSINWYYDLNVSDFIETNSSGQYVSADGNTTSDVYPLMSAYDGADSETFDLWESNPFGLDGYAAGNNYIELSFDILNAWQINGSTETPTSTSNIPLTIGFSDPWY